MSEHRVAGAAVKTPVDRAVVAAGIRGAKALVREEIVFADREGLTACRSSESLVRRGLVERQGHTPSTSSSLRL